MARRSTRNGMVVAILTMSLKTNNLPVLNCESVIPRIAIAFLLCLGLVNTPTRVHAAPTRPIDKQLLNACIGTSTKHDLAVIQGLIKKGANVNAQDEETEITPLRQAAEWDNNSALIKLLVRNGAKVDGRAYNDETPLMFAAEAGNISNMECLLKFGAKREAIDHSGQTALFHAISKPPAFRYLLDRHANFKIRDKDGDQPLHWAVVLNKIECVKWLVELGADVNARAKDGTTPIAEVSSRSGGGLAEYLMAHGANINIVDNDGPVWAHQLYDDKMLIFFLEHGAQVDLRNREGYTTLLRTASVREADTVQLLISHGADVNAKTSKGETAYTLAARRRADDYERDKIVALLIKAGEQDAKLITRQSDILLTADADEVAVIQSIVSQGLPGGMTHALINQDTISGTDAVEAACDPIHGDALKKYVKALGEKMTPDLVEAFMKSKEPSKVIPVFTGPDGTHFARDFDINESFRHKSGWDGFHKQFPEAHGSVRFSQPIFDNDHRRAILYFTEASGEIMAHGYLIVVEKSEAGWHTVQSTMLWQS